MKKIDWTPGFSSRSLKGWLTAGVPGNKGVLNAVGNAFSTGFTSTDKDLDTRMARKANRRATSARRNISV